MIFCEADIQRTDRHQGAQYTLCHLSLPVAFSHTDDGQPPLAFNTPFKTAVEKELAYEFHLSVLPISGNIHLTDKFKILEQPPLKKGPMKAYGRHHNNSFSNTPATISGKASSSYFVGLNFSSRTTSSSIYSLIDKLNPALVLVFSSGKSSSSITLSNKLPVDEHKESRCSAVARHL